MASAMQLYAGFALLVIAIIAIIVLAAIREQSDRRAAAPIREDWSIPFGHPRIAFGESARFALTPRSSRLRYASCWSSSTHAS